MSNDNCLQALQCPQCGNEDRFFIGCTTLAVVTDDGAEPHGDLEWTDESSTICSRCDWTAPLKEFRVRPRLPPDPEGVNDHRAAWAEVALAAFRIVTGADREDALADLLVDLMHWSDRNALNFASELERACWHYDAETLVESEPMSW